MIFLPPSSVVTGMIFRINLNDLVKDVPMFTMVIGGAATHNFLVGLVLDAANNFIARHGSIIAVILAPA